MSTRRWTPSSIRELLAAGAWLATYYRHPSRTHAAVLAGATWPQVAEATGTTESAARQAYCEWADDQYQLHERDSGRLSGLEAQEHAAALQRAAEPAQREAGA